MLDDDLQGEFGPDRITFVEWPGELDGIAVRLEHDGEDRRRITVG